MLRDTTVQALYSLTNEVLELHRLQVFFARNSRNCASFIMSCNMILLSGKLVLELFLL